MLETGNGLNVGMSEEVFPMSMISLVLGFNGATAKQ